MYITVMSLIIKLFAHFPLELLFVGIYCCDETLILVYIHGQVRVSYQSV